MKIFLAIFLAAVIFSGCTDSNGEIQQTSAVPTVTAPTVTESLTEPEPEPEPPVEYAELATFDPFADCVKVDDAVWDELDAAAAYVSDWSVIGWGGYAYTALNGDFCNEDDPLEENNEGEYAYYPVNEKYAKDEEQLFEIIRGTVTEKYRTDEELRKELFEDDEYGNPPNFKTIDGQLCAKHQYLGVPGTARAKLLAVESYDGETAEIVALGHSIAYPPYHLFMTLVKSEEGSWRLDKCDVKDYNSNEAILLYNGLELRQDTLNKILGGGEPLVNPKIITVNGEDYERCNIDMSVAEMEEFFAETFRERIREKRSIYMYDGEKLRETYTQKYIDDVYIEKDGAVYRKCSAPRWYLPELRLDPYTGMKQGGGGIGINYFIMEQTFRDPVTGEEFSAEITIVYKRVDTENYDENAPCEYLYIASELPILGGPEDVPEDTGEEWVYSYECGDNGMVRIYRRNLNTDAIEGLSGYDFASADSIRVYEDSVYFVERTGEHEGKINTINIADKAVQTLLEYGFGEHNCDVCDIGVWDGDVYYSAYGPWDGSGDARYSLRTLNAGGYRAELSSVYDETQSPIFLFSENNSLYIVWQEEQFRDVDAGGETVSVPFRLDRYKIFDAVYKTVTTVDVPEDHCGTPVGCDGKSIYFENHGEIEIIPPKD